MEDKMINIEEVMQHLREAMSAHIKRNSERFFPQENKPEDTKEKIEIENVPDATNPTNEVKLSWLTTNRAHNNGGFTNLSTTEHVKIWENGGEFN